MKIFFSILAFLFLFYSANAKEFLSLPIYEDINLSKVVVPEESEIAALLKGKDKERNIVLNFLKTIVFCDGVVSDVIYKSYTETLSTLDKKISEKIINVEKELLEKKKLKLVVVNIGQQEHYLPIKFIENKHD